MTQQTLEDGSTQFSGSGCTIIVCRLISHGQGQVDPSVFSDIGAGCTKAKTAHRKEAHGPRKLRHDGAAGESNSPALDSELRARMLPALRYASLAQW